MVEKVWVKGIFNKKDCSRPREDWQTFMDIYRRTVGGRKEDMQRAWEEYENRVKQENHHEFKIGRIDPHRLQQRIMKKGSKAMGLDSWQGHELKNLPFAF